MATYRWDLAVLEGADDTIDLKLAVDVGLLLLLHHRTVHIGSHVGVLEMLIATK
jgi:hypothetical protein